MIGQDILTNLQHDKRNSLQRKNALDISERADGRLRISIEGRIT
jgi:hypothetical protein